MRERERASARARKRERDRERQRANESGRDRRSLFIEEGNRAPVIAPVGLVKRECADKVAQQPRVFAPDHPDADTRTPPPRSLAHNILCQELSPHMEGFTAEAIRLSSKGKTNPYAHLLTCITPSTPLNVLPRRPSPGVGGAANARGPGGRSGLYMDAASARQSPDMCPQCSQATRSCPDVGSLHAMTEDVGPGLSPHAPAYTLQDGRQKTQPHTSWR